ncbi:MAG: gamma-glutamyltransferase [Gammaproteobacteria bacterium]|nr:gamma-glutamyltransferase [Gammaproteobacteria bacterium]MDE0367750.1 gamma-glutamyltransferase [Gammaproteobacteria bacterium]
MQPVRVQLARAPVMVFEAAHERFGKLPFAALFGPAIYFAEEGFEVLPMLEGMIERRRDVLSRRPGTKAVFTRDDGSWYATGDRFSQPELAHTLRQVAKHENDANPET